MPVSVVLMIKHMKELLALNRTLLDIAGEKRQAILENRIDDLAALVNRESRVVRDMAGVQAAWRSAAGNVLAARGFHPDSSMSLRDIAMLVRPGEGREELLKLEEQLAAAVRQVKEANERNRRLIDQSLEYVQYTLDLMAGADGPDVTYDNPSQSHRMPDGHAWTRFDARA